MQPEYRGQVLAWSCLLGPIALIVVASFGWYAAGLALAIWFVPLLQVVEVLTPVQQKKPSYARAVARMNFDQFEEAEVAVIEELEKCENDFEGWMLLAELYAEHFHDLPEAERTIFETCANPETTDSQRSVALNRLADWQLKFAHDPVAARRALEEICRSVASSHLVQMARQRLKRLPETKEEWLKQQQGRKFRLPALRAQMDEPQPDAERLSPADAAQKARVLVEKLNKEPNDAELREELARLLAEHLGKVDAGLEQLELLLTLPDQPEQKSAEWLGLMAAWQFKFKRNEASARKILERLVRQFPQSAAAFAAQRRLNLMDIEVKMRAARAAQPDPPKISFLPG